MDYDGVDYAGVDYDGVDYDDLPPGGTTTREIPNALLLLIDQILDLYKPEAQIRAEFAEQLRDLQVLLDDTITEHAEDLASSKARWEKQSKSVRTGLKVEELAPVLAACEYDFQDFRHLGGICDYLVFDGLTRNEEKHIDNVVFLDIKTGASRLNARQLALREAVDRGSVGFSVHRHSPTG